MHLRKKIYIMQFILGFSICAFCKMFYLFHMRVGRFGFTRNKGIIPQCSQEVLFCFQEARSWNMKSMCGNTFIASSCKHRKTDARNLYPPRRMSLTQHILPFLQWDSPGPIDPGQRVTHPPTSILLTPQTSIQPKTLYLQLREAIRKSRQSLHFLIRHFRCRQYQPLENCGSMIWLH